MAYYQRYPFGPRREDERTAVIVATMMNIFRGRNSVAKKPEDIFPSLQPYFKPEQDWEEMLKLVEVWNAEMGGKDLRKQ